MKRFFARLGRFFWSWRFLKIVLWTATIIVLFYAEEDWRGARAWAATKKKWEARGHSFDLNSYFAPKIPDGQNLGAIPLFRLTQAGDAKLPYLDDVTLRKAMESGWDGEVGDNGATSPTGWLDGDLPNLKAIRASLATAYLKKFGHPAPTDDALAELEALNPVLDQIREVSAQRPLCRFEYDDTQAMPATRALGLVTAMLRLSRMLTYHAVLALDEHRPDIALADYETCAKLGAAAGQDPTLVGGLVQIAVSSISLQIVWQGLVLHAWSDADLAELDRWLSSADFLAVYRFSMGAEGAVSPANFEWYKHHPADLKMMIGMPDQDSGIQNNRLVLSIVRFYVFLDDHWQTSYRLWPSGWFDLNKSQAADFILREREALDPQTHRAYPNPQNNLDAELQRTRDSLAGVLPWNFLWTYVTTPLGNQSIKFAYAQVRIDEARIACALERYRLAHQQYPATLDALAPDYLAKVPHDVMTGQPYHYEARPDGTFHLYSVGWNLTDEGGVQSFIHESYDTPGHPTFDLEHGDWPWPILKNGGR